MKPKQTRQWKVWVAFDAAGPLSWSTAFRRNQVREYVESTLGEYPPNVTIRRATLTLSKPKRKAK